MTRGQRSIRLQPVPGGTAFTDREHAGKTVSRTTTWGTENSAHLCQWLHSNPPPDLSESFAALAYMRVPGASDRVRFHDIADRMDYQHYASPVLERNTPEPSHDKG